PGQARVADPLRHRSCRARPPLCDQLRQAVRRAGMGAASHVRGGAGGDGGLVSRAARLVGAGVERGLSGVERAVPEDRLMGGRVIQFSSDYVFGGSATQPYSETSAANPVNAYGASKLAGERALAASGATYLLIRTQWLFGAHGKSFPRTMWERARAGHATRVVRDQTGRPTYTRDLAAAVWTLIGRNVCGVLHVANA